MFVAFYSRATFLLRPIALKLAYSIAPFTCAQIHAGRIVRFEHKRHPRQPLASDKARAIADMEAEMNRKMNEARANE